MLSILPLSRLLLMNITNDFNEILLLIRKESLVLRIGPAPHWPGPMSHYLVKRTVPAQVPASDRPLIRMVLNQYGVWPSLTETTQ